MARCRSACSAHWCARSKESRSPATPPLVLRFPGTIFLTLLIPTSFTLKPPRTLFKRFLANHEKVAAAVGHSMEPTPTRRLGDSLGWQALHAAGTRGVHVP